MADGIRLTSDRYEVLRHVQAQHGSIVQELGNRGACRYCRCSEPTRFRKDAHTFPEALGNKWVFSLDECDNCNSVFSRYESALAAAVGAFLTIGGVKGKRNKVRQTGRTGGSTYIRHSTEDGQRSILTMARNYQQQLATDQRTGDITMMYPIADEKFRPRHAYKALSKMGLSLLPEDELGNYSQLRAWLLEVDDVVEFPFLEVALSFAMVGRSLEFVTGTLLRRINANDDIPYTLFVLTAGSVCLQINLHSDNRDDHIPPSDFHLQIVEWTGTYQGSALRYIDPVYFNWSSSTMESQPVAAISLTVNPFSSIGRFVPIFRESSLIL